MHLDGLTFNMSLQSILRIKIEFDCHFEQIKSIVALCFHTPHPLLLVKRLTLFCEKNCLTYSAVTAELLKSIFCTNR